MLEERIMYTFFVTAAAAATAAASSRRALPAQAHRYSRLKRMMMQLVNNYLCNDRLLGIVVAEEDGG